MHSNVLHLFSYSCDSDELANLRTLKPSAGERREAVTIPSVKRIGTTSSEASDQSNSESAGAEKTEETNAQGEEENRKPVQGGKKNESSDDDSTGRVGDEEASEMDRNLDDDGGGGNEDDEKNAFDELDNMPARESVLMKKILSLMSSSENGIVPIIEPEITNQSVGGKPIITIFFFAHC